MSLLSHLLKEQQEGECMRDFSNISIRSLCLLKVCIIFLSPACCIHVVSSPSSVNLCLLDVCIYIFLSLHFLSMQLLYIFLSWHFVSMLFLQLLL